MDPEDIKKTDAAKLHHESLQLRNQQFVLATVALTGSGVSVWIAPIIIGATQERIDSLIVTCATVVWLIVLAALFYWSLALKRLISILSEYLKENGMSHWEGDYYSFSKGRLGVPSQSRYVFRAFIFYGIIAVGAALLTLRSDSSAPACACSALAASIAVYLCGLWMIRSHHQASEARLGQECRDHFRESRESRLGEGAKSRH